MTNYEKLINWLQENENTPCEVNMMAFEFCSCSTWNEGFEIIDHETVLRDVETGNTITLINDSEWELTFNQDKMEVDDEADVEAGTGHFTIAFRLL